MVEEEGVPDDWKVGVRDRSGVLVREIGDTGMGEITDGGVEGGGEGKAPFTDDGDVGSGICVGGTSSSWGSGLNSGSGSCAGFKLGSREARLAC